MLLVIDVELLLILLTFVLIKSRCETNEASAALLLLLIVVELLLILLTFVNISASADAILTSNAVISLCIFVISLMFVLIKSKWETNEASAALLLEFTVVSIVDRLLATELLKSTTILLKSLIFLYFNLIFSFAENVALYVFPVWPVEVAFATNVSDQGTSLILIGFVKSNVADVVEFLIIPL